MRREEKKRKIIKSKQKQTMQSIEERRASCTAEVKMDRDQECREIKKEAIFQGRGGRREMLLLTFLSTASRAALPAFHLHQYASKCFPVKMQPALQLILAS